LSWIPLEVITFNPKWFACGNGSANLLDYSYYNI
jgi:hypothetical protein